MRILKEGDRGQAICRDCRKPVSTTYEYRTVHLEQTGVDVPDVLVGACDGCGGVVSIPAQSTPRLKAARDAKEAVINARIPRHLDDVLHLIADRYDAPSRAFCPALFRYYLRQVARSEPLARRVGRLAQEDLAKGSAEARVSLRLPEALWDEAWEAARQAGVRSRSDLLRGVILAAMEDSTTDRAPARRRALGEIAAVA
jgi:hypothetical protein